MPSLVTRYIGTDFGTIVYYLHRNPAQSTTILYIHGLGDNRKWFPKHFKTYSLDRFSWIVPDLLGHGDSSKSDKVRAYTMKQQAKFLAAILEKEQVKDLSILAHSMGGPIAISLIEQLACQKPRRTTLRLLFYLEGNLDAGDALLSSQVAEMAFSDFELSFESWSKGILGDSEDEFLVQYVAAVREAGPFTIWASCRDLVPTSVKGDLLTRLMAHLDFSVYFIFGEKNKGVYTSESKVREAQLPLLILPEAGHGLHTENPSYFWGTMFELAQKNYA
ncbi:MAG: alpha/beta fold hydrolase [Promethearchaeota archaeon]